MTRPLHVLIDGRMLLGRFSGVSRFVTSLARELSADAELRVSLLVGNLAISSDINLQGVQVIETSFSKEDRSPVKRFVWELTKLPKIIRQVKPNVFHATWNTCVCRPWEVPTVLTIHDLIPLQTSAGCLPSGWRLDSAALRLSAKWSARRAFRIATVSDFVRSEVLRVLKPHAPKVRTIYHGTHLRNVCTASPLQRGRFVLYIGGHEPRKNIASLIASMEQYWRRYDPTLALYLTGTKEMLCPQALQAFSELGPHAPVRFLGTPSDSELVDLYSRATAFVSLSLDEGFGLPVLEAMSCRCPVIVSDRASLPEIAGEAAIIVKPDDHAKLAGEVHRLATSTQTRTAQIEAGLRRAAIFSWGHAAKQYLNLYRLAASSAESHTKIRSKRASFAPTAS